MMSEVIFSSFVNTQLLLNEKSRTHSGFFHAINKGIKKKANTSKSNEESVSHRRHSIHR